MTARPVFLITMVFIGVAALAIVGFHDVGTFYNKYSLRYGIGAMKIPVEELTFYSWYFLHGSVAVVFLTLAFLRTSLVDGLENRLRILAEKRWWMPAAALGLFAAIVGFRCVVLRQGPIADDEETYRFVAKTLLQGRVANPSPGDEAFFTNQFIVHRDGLWYGKYPIGHPLLLAVGLLVHLRSFVVPLVTTATFVVTHRVGQMLFTRHQASVGALLLLLSPHFVFMGATDLSHPAASLFMMLGLYFVLRYEERKAIPWAIAAGAVWGYGILVRPLPGLLFLPVAAAAFLFQRGSESPRRRLGVLAVGAVPVVLAMAVLLAVNEAQTGSAFSSGYHAAHDTQSTLGTKGVGLLTHAPGTVGNSVGGALLRQNFWLFGWPLSLLFVPFARPRRQSMIFFGLLAAVYAYRFVVPKTVVGTLGPVYVTEAIPLLALATAGGMARLRDWLSGVSGEVGRRVPGAVALASVIVAAACFLPVQLREISANAGIRAAVLESVERTIPGQAVVFTRFIVDPRIESTWAPHPPNPSPDLSDRIIYVRAQEGPDGTKRNLAFWQRRFPKRSAWQLSFSDKGPVLTRLEQPTAYPDSVL